MVFILIQFPSFGFFFYEYSALAAISSRVFIMHYVLFCFCLDDSKRKRRNGQAKQKNED